MKKQEMQKLTQGPQDKSPSVGSVQVAFDDLPGPGSRESSPRSEYCHSIAGRAPHWAGLFVGYDIRNNILNIICWLVVVFLPTRVATSGCYIFFLRSFLISCVWKIFSRYIISGLLRLMAFIFLDDFGESPPQLAFWEGLILAYRKMVSLHFEVWNALGRNWLCEQGVKWRVA